MKKILLSIAAATFAMTAFADTTVYFEDDFEWLAPWAACVNNSAKKPAGNSIGDNDLDANCPQLATPIVDEVNGVKAMENKGYELLATVCAASDKAAREPGKQIYIQNNYLKMGLTDYFSGLTLPAMEKLGEGTTGVKVSFDWCPMQRGANKNWAYDPTELVIVVKTGDKEEQFLVEPLNLPNGVDGPTLAWHPTTVEIATTLTKESRLTIRNIDSQFPAEKKGEMLRWFVDNIKVYTGDASSVAEIAVDENAPVEYYNLQGVRVANPANGLYIVKQGNKVSKQIIK